MGYVKWVANADRHNDWSTERVLEDGTTITLGQPVELSAGLKSQLEEEGRVFEDSSAEEAKEYQSGRVTATVGTDVGGSAPVFENAGPSNQTAEESDDAEKSGDDKKKSK